MDGCVAGSCSIFGTLNAIVGAAQFIFIGL